MRATPLEKKLNTLQGILRRHKRVLIAYSGGVDSTFLAAIAHDTLGKDNILAVTAVSETYPDAERKLAKRVARQLGLRHKFIHTEELSDKRFSDNPENRCFYCKNELFGTLSAMAKKEGMTLIDGTNFSDKGDFRPGRKAALKWLVRSPLADARLSKEDIRLLSRERELPTWNMPAQACLASRLPYGTRLTTERLRRIEKGEELLRKNGFTLIRLRDHGDTARIETSPEELALMLRDDVRTRVARGLKRLGWRYITLDIEGYRTGSLNPPSRPSLRANSTSKCNSVGKSLFWG